MHVGVCAHSHSPTQSHTYPHTDTCANAHLHDLTHAHSLTHTARSLTPALLHTCSTTDTHTLSHAYTLTCTYTHTHTSLTICPGMPAHRKQALPLAEFQGLCSADEKQRQVRGLRGTSSCPQGPSPKSPCFHTRGCQGVSSGSSVSQQSVLILST